MTAGWDFVDCGTPSIRGPKVAETGFDPVVAGI